MLEIVNARNLNKIVKRIKKIQTIKKLPVSEAEKDVLATFLDQHMIGRTLIKNLSEVNYLGRVIVYLLLNKGFKVKMIRQEEMFSFCLIVKRGGMSESEKEIIEEYFSCSYAMEKYDSYHILKIIIQDMK